MKKGVKPFSSFFNWSAEEQAKYIEKETKNLVKRLPKLKKSLQMYGEISDEPYNMSREEIELIGTTYSRAVRGGEITTPSSKRAYQDFIRKLRKYTRTSIKELAEMTAEQRMNSWLEHVRANGSLEEIAYAEKMISEMTAEEKLRFTQSKYFLDTENWGSEGFIQNTEDGDFSIQVLKLELFMKEHGHNTDDIYFNDVLTDSSKTNTSDLRKYVRHRKKT